MVIVGLTGGIGHGKTTFAGFLAEHAKVHRHWESWEVIAEVANTLRREHPEHPQATNIAGINAWLVPLPDIIATCVHCQADFTQIALTPERLHAHPLHYEKLLEYLELVQHSPALGTEEITDQNRQVFRPLLQWLGGYLVIAVDSGIWYDEIVRRIHLAAADLELATVGGVRFPGDAERLRNTGGAIIEIIRPDVAERDKQDLTERERSLIAADAEIVNDGSLGQLQACSAAVYQDLYNRALKTRYVASSY